MSPTRRWYESRTLWLAALMLATAAVDALAAGLGWRQVLLAVLAAAVAVLRLVTDEPIDRSRRRPRAPGTSGGALLLAAGLISSCGAPAWASLCSLDGEGGAQRRWLCRCAVLREVVEPLAGQPRPAGALTWTCDGKPLPLRVEAADVGGPACQP